MKIKIFILITLITFSFSAFGQENKEQDIYAIIRVVVLNNKNSDLAIVDTLSTTYLKNKVYRKEIESKINLNRKQKRILKNGDKNDVGILLNRQYLNDFKFYDYQTIFDVEAVQEKKPFCFLSNPLIFPELNIAIVNVDIVYKRGIGGSTVILKKIGEKWTIIEDIWRY
ncbi:MAG: hypothetical protein FWC39_02630 [Bacteroidetes bacterium]|nr:hypothetical protein [Bacteroidota bacterium]